MKIDINADGIPRRISVTDSDGHELIRVRNASDYQLEAAERFRLMIEDTQGLEAFLVNRFRKVVEEHRNESPDLVRGDGRVRR